MLICDDIFIYILSLLCAKDIYFTSIVSKYYRNLSKISYKIQYKKELVDNHFYNKIVEIMGGIEYLCKCPILSWKEKFLGGTGYIDNISINDVTHPIMIGIDSMDRPFITFRTAQNKKDKFDSTLEVLFQRYSDTQLFWTSGSIGQFGFISESSHFMRNGVFKHDFIEKNITNLLNDVGYITKYISINYNDKSTVNVPRVLV